MSTSLRRQMRRKEIKQFTYENYTKKKAAEAAQLRYYKAREQAKKDYEEALSDKIPKLQKIIAHYIPPVWYINIMSTLVMKICPKEKRAKILHSSWPTWRKLLNLYGYTFLQRLVIYLCVKWLLWIRRNIYTFGVGARFRIDADAMELKMSVRYWFKTIMSKTYNLSVFNKRERR